MRSLIDLVLLAHGAFALFTVLGGFLALLRRYLFWLQLPCALWGCVVELEGLTCPLTPLENRLRAAAHEPTYRGDFLAHYLTAALYPSGLTRAVQIALGTLVVAANLAAYALLYRQWMRERAQSCSLSAGSARAGLRR